MIINRFNPGFADTDALGHINNTVYPRWFENARADIFRIFTPDLDPKKWCLILAKVEIDFKAQCYYGLEVEIQTSIEKIGNSSFTVRQEVYQSGHMVATGRSVMVYFDHHNQKTQKLSQEIKNKLSSL
jgi:acyl-CoA thioester hydrolase